MQQWADEAKQRLGPVSPTLVRSYGSGLNRSPFIPSQSKSQADGYWGQKQNLVKNHPETMRHRWNKAENLTGRRERHQTLK